MFGDIIIHSILWPVANFTWYSNFVNEAVNFKNETFEGKVVCLCAKFFWAWYYLFQSLTEPDISFINLIWFSILEDSKAHRPVSIWDHQLHLMDQLSNTWHSYYYLQDCWWVFSDPLLTLLQEQHPQKNSKFILTSYYSYQKLWKKKEKCYHLSHNVVT